MSIATQRGDTGQTSLIGGPRVPKSDLRVESYGAIDELIAQMGFARSICEDAEVRGVVERIQKELFVVSSVIATAPDGKHKPPSVTQEMIDALTAQVHSIEATKGVVTDWSLPGGHAPAAALDVARTVCRRAERCLVRLFERDGGLTPQNALAYVNRLSDLLWLLGRLLEVRAGVDSRLRDEAHAGKNWSKAW